MKKILAMLVMSWLLLPGTARADVKSKAVQELAEAMFAKFGAAAGKSAPALAQRIEGFAARYGDEALVALRKVGPGTFTLVEAAGKDGAKAIRILATHGEAGATRVLNRPQAMSQYLRYGDDAATVLVRHPGVAEKMIERGGPNAVRALSTVTPQNGRRLAMVLEGELANCGKHSELLEVIAHWGDRAAVYVWENKGALMVAAALTAFLRHPEPFLDGTKDITKTVGEAAVKPLAEVPATAVKGIAAGTNWTVVILVVLAATSCYVLVRRRGQRVELVMTAPACSAVTAVACCGATAVSPATARSPEDASDSISNQGDSAMSFFVNWFLGPFERMSDVQRLIALVALVSIPFIAREIQCWWLGTGRIASRIAKTNEQIEAMQKAIDKGNTELAKVNVALEKIAAKKS